jgi:hypothetical protein
MKYIHIIFVLFFTDAASNAAVIINPSFELVSGYSTYSAPSSFSGWTVSQGSAGLPLSSLGTPQAGTQVLVPAFTSSSGTSTIFQTVSGLSAKTTYELSFWTSIYSSTTYFGTLSALVSFGSVATNFSYTIPAENRTFGSANSPWVLHSLLYTPSDTISDITISVTHSTFDPYIGFDNFTLRAIPEPTTHCLFLAAVIAGILKSRRRG